MKVNVSHVGHPDNQPTLWAEDADADELLLHPAALEFGESSLSKSDSESVCLNSIPIFLCSMFENDGCLSV